MSGEKISFTHRHTHLVACDSDGCVFDVMDVKQKECFCPAFIRHFQLEHCAKTAREVWEFVNLCSRTRGCNRFKAVALALQLLAEHPEVRSRKLQLMDSGALCEFVKTTPVLSESALALAAEQTRDDALQAALNWTRAVNAAVAALGKNNMIFEGAADALRAISAQADLLVVSQAPRAAIAGEWARAGLDSCARFIAGQEFGGKAAQIRQAMEGGSMSDASRVLVLGDAPGDMDAAVAVGAKFFPIIPGNEAASWRQFSEEGIKRFLHGRFDDVYQAKLSAEFEKTLPAAPQWTQ